MPLEIVQSQEDCRVTVEVLRCEGVAVFFFLLIFFFTRNPNSRKFAAYETSQTSQDHFKDLSKVYKRLLLGVFLRKKHTISNPGIAAVIMSNCYNAKCAPSLRKKMALFLLW